jgi:hypothetical protein
MPRYASGSPAEGVLNRGSSECERGQVSSCHCTHHCWNGDGDVLAGRDRSTVWDALQDSTWCCLLEANLANEIFHTVVDA